MTETIFLLRMKNFDPLIQSLISEVDLTGISKEAEELM
jgi:hypothetical protein